MKITCLKSKFPSKNIMKIHTCSQDGDPWAWNQINRWWFQILNAENIRFRPGIDKKSCQSSKNVKNYRFTRFEILAKKFSCPKVKSSPNPWIKILRFNSDDVLLTAFNRLLPHEYHTNWTTKPLMGVFLAECQKLEILFFNFHRFLKVISKLSKGL